MKPLDRWCASWKAICTNASGDIRSALARSAPKSSKVTMVEAVSAA
jgi:hypothetical protein